MEEKNVGSMEKLLNVQQNLGKNKKIIFGNENKRERNNYA